MRAKILNIPKVSIPFNLNSFITVTHCVHQPGVSYLLMNYRGLDFDVGDTGCGSSA